MVEDMGVAEHVEARSLDHLTEMVFWCSSQTARRRPSAHTDGPLDCGQPKKRSERFDAARNIADDRRLAKPAIVETIEMFAFDCTWVVEV
ncbi:hypothetical protein [Streptomyces sp. RPA4-5]|uniref:hypothetical protein n=1 Tax=Streptomyces sp. RPA4-5 TaxID=2721245 RepID=UPI001B3C5149|nr:hypothetical protein [Streptomyces sp. RPA4-5]